MKEIFLSWCNFDLSKSLTKLKLELFCNGLRLSKNIYGGKGRKSGAGPAGGRFIKLKNDIIGNIPIWPEFTRKSRFLMKKSGNNFELWEDNSKLRDIELLPASYKFYKKKTSTGIPMKEVALIHGESCLATTVIQTCYYWRINKQCLFCGIEGSLKNHATVAIKKPKELFETTEAAVKEGIVEHITLTTGTTKTDDKGAAYLEKIVKKISPLKIPIHVQVEPPDDFKWFDKLFEAGAETIGIHIETLNEEKFKEFCPGKSKRTGIKEFLKAWQYCVELFGVNQVDSYYLISLEKVDEEFYQNIEKIANLGVIPFLVPIRPIAGAKLMSFKKPTAESLMDIYSRAGKILQKYKLNPYKTKAGCVRCNACSAMKEAYKYLS
ncbi:MAG: MSMEG_0568 family radical SAM protein [Candidatus Lokiarchaeota archaeon]|nr:MSMEG_0568 family radical SAM protein [Candidatus Lokiarchaeota archaeon]